jgi:hypothetical protein
MEDLLDMAEKELMSIHALCDVLSAVDAAVLERNTVASLGVLISECGQRLYEYVRKLSKEDRE